MMSRWRRLSIKTKLFFVITLIPALALTLFLTQSLKIFEDDKVAYVWDSSVSFSRTKAIQVRSDLSALQGVLKTLVLNLRMDRSALSPGGELQFVNDNRILGFEVWRKPRGESHFFPLVAKHKVKMEGLKPPSSPASSLGEKSSTVIETVKVKGQTHFGLSFSSLDQETEDFFMMRLIVRGSDLVQTFNESTAHSSFLLSESGQVLLAPSDSDDRVNATKARGDAPASPR